MSGLALRSFTISSTIGKLAGLIVARPVSNWICFMISISVEPVTRLMNCGQPLVFGSFEGEPGSRGQASDTSGMPSLS